jgi:hypothetical protein
MAANASVANLKRELEQLFPGKWLTGGDGGRALRTGIAELDSGVAFAKRRIGEWIGPASSGKSTLLRAIIAQWCLSGLNVAYIDTYSKLIAADWAFVQRGASGAVPLNMKRARRIGTTSNTSMNADQGHFFVVRVSEVLGRKPVEDEGRSGEEEARQFEKDIRQQACWVAEQLIRANAFDVVIFDLAESLFLSDRIYARFKRALERSSTAMIILRDGDLQENFSTSWGRHAWSGFKWAAPVYCEKGVNGGISMILPTIEGYVSKEGQAQKMEGRLISNVPNRLFTHPQIPDRRTSKARA